ncbi:MAG: septum formation initiator family protein [Dermatophilaceae bacterium]
MAILAAVVVLLALMLVPTVRAWMDQRREIEGMRQRVAAAQQHVKALDEDKQRWADDAYVEQQARERLKFVRPGEVPYTILGADQVAKMEAGKVLGSVVTGVDDANLPWFGQVWSSIVLTDGLDRGTTTIDGQRDGQSPSQSVHGG